MSSLHAWMYRFGFPGFAEKLWILPAGVTHELPEYEPLEWLFPYHEILHWAAMPDCEWTLRELHEAAFSSQLDPMRPLPEPVDELRQAFREGRLVAWGLRRACVSVPAMLAEPSPLPIPPPPPPTPRPLPSSEVPCETCPECPEMEIQINATEDHADDLVLLKCEQPAHTSFTNCRIRLKVPCKGNWTLVELTNPDKRLRFGPSPKDDSLMLAVPPSGEWVWFHIAGEHASDFLDDAIIEAHCKDKSGKLVARATATVVSFGDLSVTITPLQDYTYKDGAFRRPVDEIRAVDFSASAAFRPIGVNASAPQLKRLRIGLVQNVMPGTVNRATYDSPKMIAWVDGAKFAEVPSTVTEIESLATRHNDSTPENDPVYDKAHLVVPGEVAASGDSPELTRSTTITRPASDGMSNNVGTVQYTLARLQMDISFVLWAVVVDIGDQPDSPQIGEICALRERTWELHLDSTATGSQKAKPSAAHVEPTMDPFTGGKLAKQDTSSSEEVGTMVTLKR